MAAIMKPTARMPQGVMRLMMPEFAETFTPEAKQKIAHHALQLKSEKGDRSAYNHLIEKIGLDTSWGRDESYFNEAFNYVLALLYAYSGQPEKMAEHARLSKTMPSPDDDQLFSDHVNCSHVAREHQQRAISRGIGPVLIACQPRSASATLTHSLGRLFDIPVLHLSIGDFPNYYLAPSWLDMFLEGGAISQDHFGATEFNVGVLSSRGPRDLFVLVRDPRAAAASLVHYRSRQAWPIDEPFETMMERLCVERFIPWIQGWIDCSKNAASPIKIHWILSDEVRSDLTGTARKICSVLSRRYPGMSGYIETATVSEVRVHFEGGDDELWRKNASPQVSGRMWEACTPDMRALLGLRQ